MISVLSRRLHSTCDLENFSRLKGNIEVNVWRPNADRVEECYFLWKPINLFRIMDLQYLFNVKQADLEGKRRRLIKHCTPSAFVT